MMKTMGNLGRRTQLLCAIAVIGLPFIAMKTAVSRVILTGQPANFTAGQEFFNKYCVQCHSLDHDKKGPLLRGVFGRKSGTVPTFRYSDALKKANVTWDAQSLDKWLSSPDDFIPDNDMDFKIADADKRAAVIAYLRQLSNQ
jgi:cytochrome c